MNQKTFFLFMMFFTLILSGCQEKSSSKKSSSSNAANVCLNQGYWQTAGCPGFCANNPTHSACVGGGTIGGTTGGTTGTTGGGNGLTGLCAINPTAVYCSPTYCSGFVKPYGCLANGTNCFTNQTAPGCPGSSTVVTPNPYWGMFYPPSGNPPSGYCSTPTGPAGALETRKGTIIIAGAGRDAADPKTEYSPFSLDAPNYLNTSTMLKSVAGAKMFFLTDASLKLRIKVNPEPEAHGMAGVCYGRGTGAYQAGYTKLKYTVKIYGTSSSNAVTYLGEKGPYITDVNNCSEVIDLSYLKEVSPTGLIVTIHDVQENKNCSPWSWNQNGWGSCSNFNKIRSMECWSMELEVAADGTKTFN